jgi:hypothetical protein
MTFENSIPMSINICFYYTNEFESKKDRMLNMSINEGFENIFIYSRDFLHKTEFYDKNKSILSLKRGAGYWLWKPFIILESLNKIQDGDIIFYLDCGDVFSNGIKSYLVSYFQNQNILIASGYTSNKLWTKRDCFYYMNCDNEQYWNTNQVEAGIIAFKKTKFNIDFIKEWITYCSNPNIITDTQNTCGLTNFYGFIEHRHDQSILTNLCVKYSIQSSLEIRNYVKCNV